MKMIELVSLSQKGWGLRLNFAAYLLLEFLGAFLLMVGISATIRHLHEPINFYDEGLILTDANMILMGKVPYRDFYSNYPPGIFLVVAGIWKLIGISVHSERILGITIRLGIAIAGGLLAATIVRRRFSFLTAGLISLWMSVLPVIAFTWLASLFAALICVLLLDGALKKGSPPGLAMAAGVALGTVSYFRHDLFVYLSLSLTALLVCAAAMSTEIRLNRELWRSILVVALAATVTVAVFWIPILVLAGPSRVAHDLYFDQVRYVVPGRRMPFPHLLVLSRSYVLVLSRYVVRLPVVLAGLFEGSVALTLLGPLLAVVVWAGCRQNRTPAAIAGALSLAVMPQMLTRTDIYHSLYAVTPALVFATALVSLAARKVWLIPFALAGTVLLFLPGSTQLRSSRLGPPAYPQISRASDVADDVAASRSEVLALVERMTRPGEAIFIGAAQHRQVYVNEMDLYFLADRPGATRYMQFDPNVTNREDVQREMIGQLEKQRVQIAILSSRYASSGEINDSQELGSDLLDQYLRAHFSVRQGSGPYTVLVRNSGITSKS
jgi:hypothetical protein